MWPRRWCRRVGNVWVCGPYDGLVLGPSWRWLLVSVTLLLAGTLVFTTYTNELPHLSLVVAVLALATLAALLACGLANAGMVVRSRDVAARQAQPRNDGSHNNDDDAQRPPRQWRVSCATAASNNNNNGGSSVCDAHAPSLFITVEQRWCSSCRLYRPSRAVHCHFCDVCVHRRDHHCPWTGNCIGAGNYAFFFALVWLLSALSAVVLCATLVGLAARTRRLHRAATADAFYGSSLVAAVTQTYCLELVLLIVAFLWLVLALALASYHTYLVTRNRTSYDALKHLPTCMYTHGSVLANVRQSLCYDAQRDNLFANDANRIVTPPPSPSVVSSSSSSSSSRARQRTCNGDEDNAGNDDATRPATPIVIAV